MSEDLILRTLDLPEQRQPEHDQYLDAVRLGFQESRASDEQRQQWWKDQQLQSPRLRGMYREQAPAGAHPGPVGTFASFDGRVNTGHGHLEVANFITDVTVRPSHRRRGLLRQMMTADLTEAAERGVAFATLTVSEGTIYGRFGFGVSTQHVRAEIDCSHGFELRQPASGSVEVVDPQHEAIRVARRELHEQVLASRRGQHQRLPYVEWALSGDFDYDSGSENRKTRSAVHYDASGRIDGAIAYHFGNWGEAGEVEDLVALTPEAELALWYHLGHTDLVKQWNYGVHDLASPLRWALADPRRLNITKVRDCTWLRVLDVEQALSVRGWDCDGAVVLEVVDPMGFAAGTYRVEVSEGRAQVARTDDAAEVSIDVDALGSAYFGLVGLKTLAGAGRVRGEAEAIARATALFEVDEPPFNLSHF